MPYYNRQCNVDRWKWANYVNTESITYCFVVSTLVTVSLLCVTGQNWLNVYRYNTKYDLRRRLPLLMGTVKIDF